MIDKGKPFVEITIADTGNGFQEEVLRELRRGNRVVDQQGEHIGIWNVMQRLQLLYNGQAEITLTNAEPKGALVKIILPFEENKLKSESENA